MNILKWARAWVEINRINPFILEEVQKIASLSKRKIKDSLRRIIYQGYGHVMRDGSFSLCDPSKLLQENNMKCEICKQDVETLSVYYLPKLIEGYYETRPLRLCRKCETELAIFVKDFGKEEATSCGN